MLSEKRSSLLFQITIKEVEKPLVPVVGVSEAAMMSCQTFQNFFSSSTTFKHSSLLRTFVNYGQKSVITMGPGEAAGVLERCYTRAGSCFIRKCLSKARAYPSIVPFSALLFG